MAKEQNKPKSQRVPPIMGMKITNVMSMAETIALADDSECAGTRSGVGNRRRYNEISSRYFNYHLISLDQFPLQPSRHGSGTKSYISYQNRLEHRRTDSGTVEPTSQTNNTQIQEILPHEEWKQDETINKVLQHLDIKYGQSRTEKVEECVEDLLRFKEDLDEEDDVLILVMKEINQRRKDLDITQDEWSAVWMLGRMRKRKKVDKYEIQTL